MQVIAALGIAPTAVAMMGTPVFTKVLCPLALPVGPLAVAVYAHV